MGGKTSTLPKAWVERCVLHELTLKTIQELCKILLNQHITHSFNDEFTWHPSLPVLYLARAYACPMSPLILFSYLESQHRPLPAFYSVCIMYIFQWSPLGRIFSSFSCCTVPGILLLRKHGTAILGICNFKNEDVWFCWNVPQAMSKSSMLVER